MIHILKSKKITPNSFSRLIYFEKFYKNGANYILFDIYWFCRKLVVKPEFIILTRMNTANITSYDTICEEFHMTIMTNHVV